MPRHEPSAMVSPVKVQTGAESDAGIFDMDDVTGRKVRSW